MQNGDVAARAIEIFKSGYNCAEAVLMAVTEALGIQSPMIPRAATPFGGGMGKTQGICGGLGGGVIAIGMALGRDELPGNRALCDRVTAEFIGWFQSTFSADTCRALSQADFRDAAQSAAFRAPGGLHDTFCVPMVGQCAEYLCAAIRKAQEE